MTSNNPAGLMYLFQIVFALYMLVTTIVLINLLIAMMSDTYQRIQVRPYSLPCDEIISHSLPCFAIAFIIPFSFNLHFRPNLTLNGSLDCRSWSGWLERELDNKICLYIVFDIKTSHFTKHEVINPHSSSLFFRNSHKRMNLFWKRQAIHIYMRNCSYHFYIK